MASPDGTIGDVLEILNRSDADRARAIARNIERRHWLERAAHPLAWTSKSPRRG